INTNPVDIHGDGPLATILRSPNASNPIISVGNGLSGIKIHDMQIDRAVTATAGGDGILWAATGVSDGAIYNMRVWKNFTNLNLGPTAFSTLFNIRAEY